MTTPTLTFHMCPNCGEANGFYDRPGPVPCDGCGTTVAASQGRPPDTIDALYDLLSQAESMVFRMHWHWNEELAAARWSVLQAWSDVANVRDAMKDICHDCHHAGSHNNGGPCNHEDCRCQELT